MKCPACYSSLSPLIYRGVEVDFCLDCGGTFFDRGELQEYLREFLALPMGGEEALELDGKMMTLGRSPSKGRKCPRCSALVHPFRYTYAPKIIFDACENCCGIWADGGEVQELAENLEGHLKSLHGEERQTSCLKACGILATSAIDAPWVMRKQNSLLGIFPRVVPPQIPSGSSSFFPGLTLLMITLQVLILLGLVAIKGAFISLPYIDQLSEFQILINLLFLGALGGIIEKRSGHGGFLLFGLAVYFFSNLLFWLFQGLTELPIIPGISALGPACLGAYLTLYPSRKLRTLFSTGKTFRLVDLSWVWYFLLWGLLSGSGVYILKRDILSEIFPQIVGFIGGATFFLVLKINRLEKREVQEFALS